METIWKQGWRTVARRSYITDLAFAKERIGRMLAGRAVPPTTQHLVRDDPSGVPRFTR